MTFVALEIDTSNKGRVIVNGTLTGITSGGTYSVPCTFLYPVNGKTKNVGILEPRNSVVIEMFGGLLDATEPPAKVDTVFELARCFLSDDWICNEEGYSYLAVEWSKFSVDKQNDRNEAFGKIVKFSNGQDSNSIGYSPFGILESNPLWDTNYHITDAKDVDAIMIDASKFLRNPVISGVPVPAAPAATKGVLLYGYSTTGMFARDWAMRSDKPNSTLGAQLPNGLVCEGIFASGCGGQNRHVNTIAPGYVTYLDPDTDFSIRGASPVSEGVVVVLNTESDLMTKAGIYARPISGATSHYRIYEQAGLSHAVVQLGLNFQNYPINSSGKLSLYRSQNPTHRALLEALRAKTFEGKELPPDALIDVVSALRTEPLIATNGFPNSPLGNVHWWAGYSKQAAKLVIADASSGGDGNVLGGIRLPHVETELLDCRIVGAPLGVVRGYACWTEAPNPTIPAAIRTATDKAVTCPRINDGSGNYPYTPPGFEIPVADGGVFIPYDDSELHARYRNHGAFVSAISHACEYAVEQRWMLKRDKNLLIQEAAHLKF